MHTLLLRGSHRQREDAGEVELYKDRDKSTIFDSAHALYGGGICMMRELGLQAERGRAHAYPAAARMRGKIAVYMCLAALGLAMLACPRGVLAASLDANGEISIFLGHSNEAVPALEIGYDGFELLVGAGSDANELFAGVGTFRWGPGRSGSLIMSGKAQPMPVIGYRLRRGNSEYVRFVGFMESEQQRRLFGHRLEYAPTPRITVGVSETAAVSGDVSAALYLPFPGLPLYALQRSASQRDRTQDRLININFGADFSVWWELPPDFALDGDDHVRAVAQPEVSTTPPRLELYGEIFIDDAQQSISNRAFIPDMVGGLIGIDLPALPGNLRLGANIEYVALTNFVYSHKNTDNNYAYRGRILGHPLGPDSDALILTLSFRPHDRTKLTLSGSIERHGEGRVGQPWSRESDPDDWFLSGVVEKGARVSLGVEHDLWGPVVLAGSLEYAARSNSNNVMGESRKDWAARIGIGARL